MSLALKLMRGALGGLALVPDGPRRALGRGLGRLVLSLDRRHRRIIQDNLARAFPGRERAWVARTARDCLAHIGQVALEIPLLIHLRPKEILARTRFHGLDNFQRAMDQGRGVLFLTGHIGNWEWTSVASGLVLGPCCVVARPIDWPPADELVNQWRTRSGHVIVPKDSSARRILAWLRRERRPVGILLDQNVDWYEGPWVEFFGRPACTNKGLALLALATRAPVLPFYCFRAEDGSFDVYIDPEIPLVRSGDKLQDVWQNTQNYTRALEEIIRRRPEQWFWIHQRWKTRPYQPWPRERKK